jgi:hypothetical protein
MENNIEFYVEEIDHTRTYFDNESELLKYYEVKDLDSLETCVCNGEIVNILHVWKVEYLGDTCKKTMIF